MKRFEVQKTNVWALALLLTPIELMYAFSTAHVTTNLPTIMTKMGIDQPTASWIQNIETICGAVMATMTGRFGEKYGIPLIFAVGVAIYSLGNLAFAIPGVGDNLLFIILFRGVASIGQGLFQPSLLPLGYLLVPKEKLNAIITVVSVTAPAGAIISSFIAGDFAKAYDWYFMCVIVGIVMLVTLFFVVALLPYEQKTNKATRFDVIGTFLFAVAIFCLVLGLISFSGMFASYITSSLILFTGLMMFVIFFMYNNNFSTCPIFANGFFSASYIRIFATTTLSYFPTTADKTLQNFFMRTVLHVPPQNVGRWLALSYASSFLVAPLTVGLPKIMVMRNAVIIFIIVQLSTMALSTCSMFFFPSLGVTVTTMVFGCGMQIAVLVMNSQLLFQTVPKHLSPTLGVFSNILQYVNVLLGNTMVAVLRPLLTANDTVTTGYPLLEMIAAGFVGGGLFLAFFIGVYEFERGKKGWSSKDQKKTDVVKVEKEHEEEKFLVEDDEEELKHEKYT